MLNRLTVLAFDVDADSLHTLRQTYPEWQINVIRGATAASLTRDWNLGSADLLLVGAEGAEVATVGLCRRLRSQSGRSLTPLMLLVEPQQEELVRAALEAGVHGCLVRPIHPKQIANLLSRTQDSNQPGRHTLDLTRAQREDVWRDEGGES